jgi:hypothetical protein
MKLTTMTQVTIDGVMQGNGEATEEERRSGFMRGGWARGKGDQETDALINQTYDRADAFLLGRRTTSCTHARGDPSRNRMSPGLL